MIGKHSIFLILVVCLSSCYSNKKLTYLQGEGFSNQAQVIKNPRQLYHIQPNDVLSVKVKSATDPEISDIFNVTSNQGSTFLAPGSLYLEGYSVDDMGQISLPILGLVTVNGLTVEQVQQLIQDKAQRYLNNATVIVKLISYKITVLGEVRNPGYYYVYNNQATILEGLGLAGDLTQFGNRTRIKLIRQHATGSEVVMLNLSDAKILASEYYYLMPNDVLYVETMKAITKRLNLDLLTIVFSAATTAILILNYIETN